MPRRLDFSYFIRKASFDTQITSLLSWAGRAARKGYRTTWKWDLKCTIKHKNENIGACRFRTRRSWVVERPRSFLLLSTALYRLATSPLMVAISNKRWFVLHGMPRVNVPILILCLRMASSLDYDVRGSDMTSLFGEHRDMFSENKHRGLPVSLDPRNRQQTRDGPLTKAPRYEHG